MFNGTEAIKCPLDFDKLLGRNPTPSLKMFFTFHPKELVFPANRLYTPWFNIGDLINLESQIFFEKVGDGGHST